MSESNRPPDLGSREQKRALLSRLLRQQTGKSRAQSASRFVHELFQTQAERTPEAVALTGAGVTLSYRELNQQANRIAAELIDQGAKPEARIGLCLERSTEAIVGLVGIFKAGASYVPLSPHDPLSRLSWLVQNAGISLLLGQRKYGERLPVGPVCCFLDDLLWNKEGGQGENPRPVLQPGNLAYVVYTSGSTGTPKGVLVEHRALSNLIAAQVQAYEVGPTSRVLQFASLSFDASIGEIWRTLASGARLCVLPGEARLDGEALLAFLVEQGITHATLPPTLLSSLPEAPLPALTNLIVGGDACPAELVSRWAPGRRFFNAYGPSEATVCATFARCTSDPAPLSGDPAPLARAEHGLPPLPGRKPAIGRPITNTTAYVLDAHLRPVPLGMPGELHLGGIGLARGYLGRPGLTAERFIPNPFAEQPGARLYKTGDLCRWLPGDGRESNLEFLGRIDQQVKVRGYRIEPGEIEASLYHHPLVRQAVVVARDDREQGKRLIAYVVLADAGTAEDTNNSVDNLLVLRNHLAGELPQYMVPSAFVFLQALPLTPSGKVDVKSLPDPAQRGSGPEAAHVSPRNQREEILAGIWARLLKRDRVGVHDNFFGLGGDSILSIQIVARANQAGLRLRVRDVLQHQTIAELAQVAEDTHSFQADQGVVTGPVPLTPIQHWFFEQELPDAHHSNQAIVLEVRQQFDPELFGHALQYLVEHHDALRLRFVRDSSGWQQVNTGTEIRLALSRIDLSLLCEEEQVRALQERATEMQSGFNLGSPPLLRVAWFDRGAGRTSWLLLIGHHLVVDTISWAILLEDLWTAYRQLHKGQPVRLPAKTTAFKHWAERLVAYARSDELARERDYWLSLARADVPRLPVDHLQGANTRQSSASVDVVLGVEDSQGLLEVPRVHKTQINEILLTALVLTFERWTAQRRLLLALEGHGREEVFPDVDLSRSVGWYTSLFPVLLDLGSAGNQGEALQAVKEQLNAVPNRGIGYGILRYLSPGGASATTSLHEELRTQLRQELEVSFNYFGQIRGAGESGPGSRSGRQAILPTGPAQGTQGMRNRLLSITCSIRAQLEMHWSFSTNVHERATIEGLARDYLETLRSLIAFCQAPEGRILTAADFPAARLSETDLEKVLAQLGSRGGVK